MIRVVHRNIFEAEGTLLGEFAPDQVNDLELLLLNTDMYDGEGDPAKPFQVLRQFVPYYGNGQSRPPTRIILELITDPPDSTG